MVDYVISDSDSYMLGKWTFFGEAALHSGMWVLEIDLSLNTNSAIAYQFFHLMSYMLPWTN